MTDVNVLMTSAYFEGHRGGIEIVAGELARALVAIGGTALSWVACDASDPPADFPGEIVPITATNLMERHLALPIPILLPSGIKRLYTGIAQADIVVIHDTLYPISILAYLFARARKTPVVIIQHVGLVPYRNPLVRAAMAAANRLISRPLLGGADTVVFISEITRRYFSRFCRFRNDPQLLFNGLARAFVGTATETTSRRDARESLSLPVEPQTVAFVGRFVEKKGLPILRSIAAELTDIPFVLAGWGDIDPEQWGLANVTVLTGRSGPSLVPVYRAADLLVLPSVGEGFPLVIQEALACGTAVLTSDETATADPWLADRVMTAPIDPDDPQDTAGIWAAACRKALSTIPDDAARSAVAAAARDRYDWATIALQYRTLLLDAMGGHQAADARLEPQR